MREKRRLGRILAWVGAGLIALTCVSCAALAILMDQTALAANVYLQAVSSGNDGMARLMGDHFSADAEANRARLELDLARDLEWLRGAAVSDVQTTREQTLSGQWVTVLRFKWRPGGSISPPQEAALRVKTEKWFVMTYIRTVEVIGP